MSAQQTCQEPDVHALPEVSSTEIKINKKRLCYVGHGRRVQAMDYGHEDETNL
jgi:hypothetical protein